MSKKSTYNKTPFRYSAEYQRWSDAVRSNRGSAAVREASRAHAERFAPHVIDGTKPKDWPKA